MTTNPKETAAKPAAHHAHPQGPDPARGERLKAFLAEYRQKTKRLPKGDGDLQWLYEVRSNCFLPEHGENAVDDAEVNYPESEKQ